MWPSSLFRTVVRAVLLLVLVVLGTRHFWPRHRTGLRVRIAMDRCDCSYVPKLLTVNRNGEIWMMSKRLEQRDLVIHLAMVYALRQHVLYLLADESMPFQKVADVIDAVQGATQPHEAPGPVPEGLGKIRPDNLDIEIRLVTPGSANKPCHIDCDVSQFRSASPATLAWAALAIPQESRQQVSPFCLGNPRGTFEK